MMTLCTFMGLVWTFATGAGSPPETGGAQPQPRQLLKVGDPAPPLSVQEWITNSPVDIAAGKGKECYAIWLWQPGDLGSTQLTPRLTILQNRYLDKGLKIVGVVTESETNTLEAVRKFVTDAGPKVSWTAGYDKAKETWVSWMVASLKPGEGPVLPKVFLVDRKGIIVWIGVAADPDFEDVVVDVVEDKHDMQVWAKVYELWSVMGGYMNRREFDKAQSQLDEILRVYPASSKAINAKVFVYVQQMRDFPALRAWARDYLAAYAKDPHAMHRLATALSRPVLAGDLADRDPLPALRASRIAYEAGKDSVLLGDVAPLYARNLKEVGAVKLSLAVLTDACERIKGFEVEPLKAELEYYKKCLACQLELDTPLSAVDMSSFGTSAKQPAAPASGKAEEKP